MDDYGEYCHYVAGLVGTGLFKLFKASGKQNLVPENLSNEMDIFLQELLTLSKIWMAAATKCAPCSMGLSV
ncbi:hypothetical protein QYF36_009767 [Acer negundo]|nr:hypothetical protein QYF36_009767 [Acer negundo]